MRTLDDLLSLVEARRNELGLSQAQLGMRAFGRPDSSLVQNMKRGSEPTYSKLLAIADALDFELYFGPPRGRVPSLPTQVDGSEYEAVRRYSAEFSAGTGALNHDDVLTGAVAFRRDWMARVGVTPSTALVATVKGDSMLPTLSDGDLVLIDSAKRIPRGRRIYALIAPDGEARIKRLEKLPAGLLLQSDNDDYASELIPTHDADRVNILGEVVWWGHTVGGGERWHVALNARSEFGRWTCVRAYVRSATIRESPLSRTPHGSSSGAPLTPKVLQPRLF